MFVVVGVFGVKTTPAVVGVNLSNATSLDGVDGTTKVLSFSPEIFLLTYAVYVWTPLWVPLVFIAVPPNVADNLKLLTPKPEEIIK